MAADPKFVTISPKMATAMIEAHEDVVRDSGLASLNRIINENTVKQYESDMSSGKWIRNGESIKIAENGRVLDGQHRLWACVNANASFPTLLVNGIS